MAKLPYFPFYVGDWKKSPEIRALDLETRMVWFEMLLLMWESNERGFLLINGKVPNQKTIGFILGINQKIIKNALIIMADFGVYSVRESDGAIYSRKMVKDEEIRVSKSSAGSKGMASRYSVKADSVITPVITPVITNVDIDNDIGTDSSVLKSPSVLVAEVRPIERISDYTGLQELRKDDQFDIDIFPPDGLAAIALDLFRIRYRERYSGEYPIGSWDRRTLQGLIKENGFETIEKLIIEYFRIKTRHTVKEFSNNISDGFDRMKIVERKKPMFYDESEGKL